MSNRDELACFLDEGLKRYSDARQAVDFFEREIQDRLIAILEGKRDWESFIGQRGSRGRGKAFSVGRWNNSDGCGIWASQLAADGSGGWIDLGLWWGSRKAPDGVLVFASRWEANYKVRELRVEPREPVRYETIAEKPRLFVVLDTSASLEGELVTTSQLLLDELDRALQGDPYRVNSR